MVRADVINALRLCKQVEPTTELIIHSTKQGSYLFSVKVKGRTRLKEANAQATCEKLCDIANVKPFQTNMRFPPTVSIFATLYIDRLRRYGMDLAR